MNFENYKQEMKTEQKTSMEYDGGMNMNYQEACPYAMEQPMMPNACCMPNVGPSCMPIYECPRENICHRYICYEVPQV